MESGDGHIFGYSDIHTHTRTQSFSSLTTFPSMCIIIFHNFLLVERERRPPRCAHDVNAAQVVSVHIWSVFSVSVCCRSVGESISVLVACRAHIDGNSRTSSPLITWRREPSDKLKSLKFICHNLIQLIMFNYIFMDCAKARNFFSLSHSLLACHLAARRKIFGHQHHHTVEKEVRLPGTATEHRRILS